MCDIRHLIKYIKGVHSDVFVLGDSEFGTYNEVEVFSDINWANELSCRSTSGGATCFNDFLLQNYARTQSVVAL
eukprot:13611901-Heterocapsa_arctica.AAC.1